MRHRWGIVGGMGALASAEFAKTIYEHQAGEVEQDSPVVILYSDPTFPDRTRALREGSAGAVAGRLSRTLSELRGLGVTRVVLCCVTLHYALPLVEPGLRRGVVSLIEVALAGAAAARRRQLLLCSSGVRAARLFQDHEGWRAACDYVTLPDEADQELVHGILYRYKVHGDAQPLEPHLQRLLSKYGADSFIAGCSELHMLTKYLKRRGADCHFVDPLAMIAENLPAYE
jgi:aspartate racemase